MKYNPKIDCRRSIRLKGYDYSRSGAYFVTICTKEKECLLGNIEDGRVELNDAGAMIKYWWIELQHKFGNIKLDEFIIMPNHIHGIIIITVGADRCVCPHIELISNDRKGEHAGSPLHRIIQWFKTMATNKYIIGVKKYGWQPFNGKLWQRNYYEHIIRNENSLNRIREYIINNPIKWGMDFENPGAASNYRNFNDYFEKEIIKKRYESRAY
jgi:REP element-mobilizing transposase RayT